MKSGFADYRRATAVPASSSRSVVLGIMLSVIKRSTAPPEPSPGVGAPKNSEILNADPPPCTDVQSSRFARKNISNYANQATNYKSFAMKLFTISLPSARAAVRQASFILLAISSMLTYASAKTGNPKGNPGKGLSTCPTSISIDIAPPAYCTNTQGVLGVNAVGGSFTSPSYSWSASSGRVTISPTNSATPDIDYISIGNVTILVTVTDAGCGTYTASQNISVSSTPEPTITIPTTEVCQGNTISNITGSPAGNTRQWTVNNFSPGNPFGIFSAPTNQTTNFTTSHPGNAQIFYQVTTTAGCTGTSEAQPVTIYAPVVATASVASGNQPNVCAGSSLTLAASATGGNGTYTYEWEYMGGSQAVPAFVSAAILLDSLNVANPVLTPVGTASDGDTYIFRVKATD
ncbi:MAG: hypothetical protein RL742_70, partial [Bacteroidota bacterium]